MSEPTPTTGDPTTGDPVVDEVLETFRGTEQQPLPERAEAALQAQRRLQERLSESSPGNTPAAAMQRVAGGPQSA
ncbi:hypothetical protein [Ornithinimicrobium faecis]|uniref:Uncharacterized protein n=1 Tax=Ornithinimicrobium faecis TaxID=2934158 RepID=A0ABY4YNL3_9MICO|nr:MULTISPECIES: hypothetical protein [unclassified Ornithinimicrobium]USQ78382.1 hypothetical protein NF556_12060 [Ornithinimicrobium sp. HY1793]